MLFFKPIFMLATAAVIMLSSLYFLSSKEVEPVVKTQPNTVQFSGFKSVNSMTTTKNNEKEQKLSSISKFKQPKVQEPIGLHETDLLTHENITLKDRLTLLQDQRPNTLVSRDDMQLGLSQTNLWKSGDKFNVATQLPYLTEEQINDGREFIHFQKLRLEVTLEGEQFQIALPNREKALVAQVAERTVLEGIIHWRGFFPDERGNFQEFSFTQALGDDYVVGNIYVSGETYSIEAKNGFGWIALQGDVTHLDDGGVHTKTVSH